MPTFINYSRIPLSASQATPLTVSPPPKPSRWNAKNFWRGFLIFTILVIATVITLSITTDVFKKTTAIPVITTTSTVTTTTHTTTTVTANTTITTTTDTTTTITATTMPEFAYCDGNECAKDCSTPNCGTGCNGIFCAHSCTGMGCGSMCTKGSCAYNCTNTDCGQTCNGITCGNQCSGANCASNCIGYECAALCTGDNCGTHCIGPQCARNCTGTDCGKGCAYPPNLDSTSQEDWSCALNTQNAGNSIEMGKNCTDIQNITNSLPGVFDPELCNYLNHPAVWPMLEVSIFGTPISFPLPSTTEQCYKDNSTNVCTQTTLDKPVLMCTLPGKACNTPGLPLCSSTRLCGKCQGHCSNNNDCRGDLECKITDHTAPGDIPGCSEQTPDMYYETGKGYCYDPSDTSNDD